jgi:hypothetical protein
MGYDVTKADPERDRELVVAHWSRHLNLPAAAPWYEWAHLANPNGAGANWILRSDGRLVGTAGWTARSFNAGRTSLTAGRVGGFGVDAGHRVLGPALMLQKALLAEMDKGDPPLLYSSAPPQLLPLFSRVGYERIGPLTRYARVLRAAPYLERLVGASSLPAFLSRAVDVPFVAWAAAQWRPGVVQRLEAFDERFDDLWERAKPHYGVTSLRSRRLLTWRFLEMPARVRQEIFAVATPSADRLIGYAVVSDQAGTCVVADMFAETPDDALECTLLAVVRHAVGAGCTGVSIRCLETAVMARVLRRCGFGRRDDGSTSELIASPGWRSRFPDRSADAGWYFVGGDDFWD